MKRIILAVMLSMLVLTAGAMSLKNARQQALFLSDKMAYELWLTEDQYEAVYEINLDYFLSLRYESDIYGVNWNRRNTDLRFVLTTWQYRGYITTTYFYEPVAWRSGVWTFRVYSHYSLGSLFRPSPPGYKSYKGGRNRGTISFYEGLNIKKPRRDDAHPGPSWKLEPIGGGQSGNAGRPGTAGGRGVAPQQGTTPPTKGMGTNNRSTGGTTGSIRFGETSKPASSGTQSGNNNSTGKPSGSQPGGNNGSTGKPSGTQPGGNNGSTGKPSGTQSGGNNGSTGKPSGTQPGGNNNNTVKPSNAPRQSSSSRTTTSPSRPAGTTSGSRGTFGGAQKK